LTCWGLGEGGDAGMVTRYCNSHTSTVKVKAHEARKRQSESTRSAEAAAAMELNFLISAPPGFTKGGRRQRTRDCAGTTALVRYGAAVQAAVVR